MTHVGAITLDGKATRDEIFAELKGRVAALTAAGRTPADNATVRSVFLIGPDKRIKAMLIYPMSSGRNFDEILRLLDSAQLTAASKVATPANWNPGDDVIIAPSVADAEAKEKYPEGWESPTPYIRYVSEAR